MRGQCRTNTRQSKLKGKKIAQITALFFMCFAIYTLGCASIDWPFTPIESSDIKYRYVGIKSAGVFNLSLSSPGNAMARIAVRVAPGLMQLIRIFVLPTSLDQVCIMPSVANFEIE